MHGAILLGLDHNRVCRSAKEIICGKFKFFVLCVRGNPLYGKNDFHDNNDGTIEAEELANAVAALKSLDKNHDGKLSPEEYRPQLPGGPGGKPQAPPAAR